MCGLTGFFQYVGFHADLARISAIRMADSISHRGPDDWGVWLDERAGIVLAHQRLSILDLSLAGHQPMLSASGRFVIVFNGEIYNHRDLRSRLEASNLQPIEWKGYSDTETLLACIEEWGLEEVLKKVVGMFAIALWDNKEQVLFLARDRMGEKPLYYGWQNDIFLFGSELKALKAHPAFAYEIDRNSLALQLRHNYIPAPYSIYRGIRKLLPGTFLKLIVDRGRLPVGVLPEPSTYWSLKEAVTSGQKKPFDWGDKEAVIALEKLLRNSVQQQMVADVPFGAFLSGGIDSSTIVALMQAQSDRPVKTFTIGFNEEDYNEAKYAQAVARHLGTDHTELYVSPQQVLEVIPRLPVLYDEPFSDSSQIPSFLISQLTRQYVTVSLSGDAGDELFGGYDRYFIMMSLLRKLKYLPLYTRKKLAWTLDLIPLSIWDVFMRMARVKRGASRKWKGVEILGAPNPESAYRWLVSHCRHPSEVVIGAIEPPTMLTDYNVWLDNSDFEHSMMYLDAMSYLPDDILVKVDRAAMSVSLETRMPFLDHRVVEFAWRLPLSKKMRNGQGKWILRNLLYKYVPEELINRPKMGFGVPIESWLRGPLRDWAEALLNKSRLRQEGFFNPAPIRQKWAEHLNGQRNWHYHLWDVLMFQIWLEGSR